MERVNSNVLSALMSDNREDRELAFAAIIRQLEYLSMAIRPPSDMGEDDKDDNFLRPEKNLSDVEDADEARANLEVLEDADEDGETYGRKDGEWATLSTVNSWSFDQDYDSATTPTNPEVTVTVGDGGARVSYFCNAHPYTGCVNYECVITSTGGLYRFRRQKQTLGWQHPGGLHSGVALNSGYQTFGSTFVKHQVKRVGNNLSFTLDTSAQKTGAYYLRAYSEYLD